MRQVSRPIDGKIRSVSGPHSAGDRWSVRVVTHDGQTHNRSFAMLARAEDFVVECSAAIEPDPVAPPGKRRKVYAPKGSAGWVKLLAAKTAELCNSDNPFDRKELRLDLAAIAGASKAVKGLLDNTEIESKVAEIEKKQAKIDSTAKHGTGAQRSYNFV